KDVFVISAATKQGLDELMKFVFQKIEEIPAPEIEVEIDEDLDAYDNDDSDFEVIRDKKSNSYFVVGGKVERLASVTDERNNEQVYRLQNILIAMGVFEKLKQLGIKDGDTIVVGNITFSYYNDEYMQKENEE
ncbi:MAG: Obg family GTPase CgtA, partial [bacterium]